MSTSCGFPWRLHMTRFGHTCTRSFPAHCGGHADLVITRMQANGGQRSLTFACSTAAELGAGPVVGEVRLL